MPNTNGTGHTENRTGRIERRRCPLYSDFRCEFLEPRKPVVISSALDRWQALSRWTPAFFKQTYGAVPLHANNQPYTLGGFLPKRKDGSPLTLGEFIDLVLASSNEKPAPYLRNVHIEKFLPELDADLRPVPDYFQPNWLEGPAGKPLDTRLHGGRFELYIGGTGGKFPVLHYDTWHIHTFLSQIYGVKRYTLFAPDQSRFLYPRGNQSQVDLENVDIEKFPLFASATPISCDLQAGEILFVPAGWWHTTRILTPSITVSASRVNASNWRDFSHDLKAKAPKHVRPLLAAYLTSLRLYHAISL
ncbi:MAG TPA: cupin-like domain-containing protein [Candidatus Acidoferrales bacterium]|nr:cupin-like domain-containing protein [Candidatus Acidoferrales bacterium]